jgi:hypothetical protein
VPGNAAGTLAATNYDFPGADLVAGTLTIGAAPLTITADNKTMVYGGPLPALTASFSGLVNGDTSASLTTPPTLHITASAASHVAGSPYAITASGRSIPTTPSPTSPAR